VPHAIRSEGKVIGDARCFDSRQSADTGDDLLKDHAAFGLAGFIRGSAVVVVDLDGCGAVGLKTEVNVQNFDEAPKQTRARDHGPSDLVANCSSGVGG
jgi:hypothetical protein